MQRIRTIGLLGAFSAVMLVVCLTRGFAQPRSAPRVPPLDEVRWEAEHHELVKRYGADVGAGNNLRTLLNYPEVVEGVMPFAAYVSAHSSLSSRDRELLILRTAWLCQNEYAWAQHAGVARHAGIDAREIHRIAEGADAPGWRTFEAALLRSADELVRHSVIGDATWNTLSSQYDTPSLIDAVFTVAEFTMLGSLYNSLGVEPDPWLTDRLPADVPYRFAVGDRQAALTTARVPPIEPAAYTPDIRAMLDPQATGRPIIAIYRTIARHPRLYPPRQHLSEYIRLHSALTPRVREALILRIGWLCRSDYEWAQHVRQGRAAGLDTSMIAAGPHAPGWAAGEALLLRAADELFAKATVSDGTWKALAMQFDNRQLMDMVITTAGYRMVSMALNTLGVQLEPGNERFPAVAR